MKIKIITVSRSDDHYSGKLFGEYLSRINHYITTENISLRSSNRKNIAEQKKGEATSILSAVKKNEELILLDESGKEFSSLQFSSLLQKRLNAGRDLVFVIGGAYGFDDSLKQQSSLLISLSKMTLPHQLAKVIFAEQLYRAFTILRNEKYHHGG